MSLDFDPTSTLESGDVERGVTRRSVVKTGAHLAWAVPAVSMVTAAPALAVSGKSKLRMGSFGASAIKGGADVDLGPIKNTGTRETGVLTAVFELPSSLKKAKVSASSVSSGWKVVDGKGQDLTFVSTGTVPPGGKSKALSFVAKQKGLDKKPKGTVSVVVKAKNGGSVTDSDKL